MHHIEERSVPRLVEKGVAKVPEKYICFPNGLSHSTCITDIDIPVIDLSDLQSDEGRCRIVGEIDQACKEWGFFHVVNHDVCEESINNIMQVAEEFFELPMEEKMKYFSAEPSKTMSGIRYGLQFDSNGVQDWRDFLDLLKCYPLTEDVLNTFPASPHLLRNAVKEYCEQVRALALTVISLISQGLGLEGGCVESTVSNLEQSLLINRYLPCPEPHLVLGVRPHCDPGLITVLLMNQVQGLQVKKFNSWVTVKPIPNSLVVNLGDQLQILSNSKYKSVEHRALANSNKTRFSLASFFNPPTNELIKPLPQLVDEQHPAQYAALTFEEYLKIYLSQRLSKRTLQTLTLN